MRSHWTITIQVIAQPFLHNKEEICSRDLVNFKPAFFIIKRLTKPHINLQLMKHVIRLTLGSAQAFVFITYWDLDFISTSFDWRNLHSSVIVKELKYEHIKAHSPETGPKSLGSAFVMFTYQFHLKKKAHDSNNQITRFFHPTKLVKNHYENAFELFWTCFRVNTHLT